jgi:hypothetical protein
MISIEDRLDIHECIALHGHLVDSGRLDEMNLAFTEDFVQDLRAFGFGVTHGLASIKEVALKLGKDNPLGHHVTNTVIVRVEGDKVYAQSKGFGVTADRMTNTVVYEDVLVKQQDGWRIAQRKIIPRDSPLGGILESLKK